MADGRRVAVVVPAGGSGTRLGRATPKQFLALGGVPIVVATLRALMTHPAVDPVVVAAPAALVTRTARLLARHFGRERVAVGSCVAVSAVTGDAAGVPCAARGRRAHVHVVAGGAARQDSVWLGFQAVPADRELVLVHDAVRPFITRHLVDDVIRAASAAGAAICALPVVETVKRVRDGRVDVTVDRQGLWTAQTPQGFRSALLREAHEKARRDGVIGTDDAMLVERLGHVVAVVRGRAENVKITTPEDLQRARLTVARGGAKR